MENMFSDIDCRFCMLENVRELAIVAVTAGKVVWGFAAHFGQGLEKAAESAVTGGEVGNLLPNK